MIITPVHSAFVSQTSLTGGASKSVGGGRSGRVKRNQVKISKETLILPALDSQKSMANVFQLHNLSQLPCVRQDRVRPRLNSSVRCANPAKRDQLVVHIAGSYDSDFCIARGFGTL
jgi:hypothetical protein